MRVAVIAITGNGAVLGRKLLCGLTDARLFVSQRYIQQSGKKEEAFEPGELKNLVASLWREMDALVFIMASGIVVRVIAPHLQSKATDPAVVVMDDAGTFAISLLSGHLGGANELACACASLCCAQPVITTATDVNGLPSFDLFAKGQGWVIDDLASVKRLNSLLLDKQRIAVVDASGRTRHCFRCCENMGYYDTFSEAISSGARGFLFVTNRYLPPQGLPANLLILRPRNLVLGIGCNRDTPVDEIDAFVGTHLRRLFLSMKSVRYVASAAAKRDEAGLLEFSRKHGIEVVFYESDELNRVETPSEPSAHALAAIGAMGVAEPAALLASDGGRLLLKKVKSSNVTLAVAELNGEHRALP